jgi:hypothetical protein
MLRISAAGTLVERLCPKEVGEELLGICKDGTVPHASPLGTPRTPRRTAFA